MTLTYSTRRTDQDGGWRGATGRGKGVHHGSDAEPSEHGCGVAQRKASGHICGDEIQG